MFGDMGHGLFLFLVGAFLCLFDGPIRNKFPGAAGLLTLRYIVLLMGFFALYCGIIYNDFMAIPVWFFESCYELKDLPVDPHAEHPQGGHHHTP